MCTSKYIRLARRRQAGISFVELVLFIIVVGVGIAGILSVMNITVFKSADPMVQKQAIAIAESLLEEIEMQPFTFCDPDDANALTATGTGGCTVVEGFGPEAGETRTNVNTPFDNVNDYVTASGAPTDVTIIDVSDNSTISGLAGYAATVTITQHAIGAIPAAESLRIDVRVTGPAGVDVTITGYRLRYAPNAV